VTRPPRISKAEKIARRYFAALLFIVFGSLLFSYCFAEPAESPDKQRVVDKVVENWLAVAGEQYNRAFYIQAEQSLLRAREYQVYLIPAQSELIDRRLEEARSAALSKEQLLDKLEKAKALAGQGELLHAKAYLSEVLQGQHLGQADRESAKMLLKHTDVRIADKKRLMAELFKRSKKHYEKGNYEDARQGFVRLAQSGLYTPAFGMSAEDYLAKIQRQKEPKQLTTDKSKVKAKLPPRVREEKRPAEKKDETIQDVNVVRPLQEIDVSVEAPAAKAKDVEHYSNAQQDSSGSENNMLLNYIKAVVLDAETKAVRYAGRSEFNQAFSVIEDAKKTLQAYQNDVDERAFEQNSARLQTLKAIILERQQQWIRRWDTRDGGN